MHFDLYGKYFTRGQFIPVIYYLRQRNDRSRIKRNFFIFGNMFKKTNLLRIKTETVYQTGISL